MTDTAPTIAPTIAPAETPVETPSRPVTDDGDHDRFAHYARKDDVARAYVTGEAIVALCGKKWVPTRDPKNYPVCPPRPVAAPDLGSWAPLPLTETVARFTAAPFRWWISGGLALELHTGRSWRDHSDTDVGVLRRDAPGVVSVLVGWDLQVASGGALSPSPHQMVEALKTRLPLGPG